MHVKYPAVYLDTDMYNVNSPGVWGNEVDGKAFDDDDDGITMVDVVETDLDDDESIN